MDVIQALYTTRTMRRMKPDAIPNGILQRILDATIRAPNGGNAQRWHFVVVDDASVKEQLKEIYISARKAQYADFRSGAMGSALDETADEREARLARLKASGDYLVEHFCDTPFFILFFALRDRDGGNLWPAIWSSMLAARSFGVGSVLSTLLRYEEERLCRLLDVPADEGWSFTACVGYGYPRGRWGVAQRRPVHEVTSSNRWGKPLGFEVPEPLWPLSAEATQQF